jgi:hypothetical protein
METFIHIFSPAAPCFGHILAFFIPGNQGERKISVTLPLAEGMVSHERSSGESEGTDASVR